MQKIVLASNNKGKVHELDKMLSSLNMEVLPQATFNIEDADETGLTFIENAIIKARHASAIANLPAIADDSGLEVDFLNGAPGIYSARYSGEDATDEQNLLKLLDALKDVSEEKRTARFQCLLVYLRHANDPTPLICQGTWEGVITTKPQGENGFGYDPIFYVPEYNCTSAQLSSEQKNKLSHRGIALKALMSKLTKPYQELYMLEENQTAPAFSSVDQNNNAINLSDFAGKKNVILYFYPKDDTPGCTIQANQFTAHIDDFAQADTIVIGVSKDDCQSHQAFIDKFDLKVELIADTEGKLCEDYDVWQEKEKNGVKKMGLVRSTFIINKEGKLSYIEYGVAAEGHAEKMLAFVKNL